MGTSSSFALPLSSSSLSFTLIIRAARSTVRSLITLVSDLHLSLNLSNSSSATFSRDCSCPLARRASARSLLSCMVMSAVGGLEAGSFDAAFGTQDDMRAAFSASRAAVRSASLVSIHG